MELSKATEIQAKPTPSMHYNNLSCTRDGLMVYSSQTDAVVVRPLGPHRIPLRASDKSTITHTSLITARGRNIVVITTSSWTQLWDEAKEVMLTHVVHGTDDMESRGSALVEFGDRLLGAVGHGTGEVSLIDFGADFSANVFSKTKAHQPGVTCIAGSNNAGCLFVSGDNGGEIVMWTPDYQPSIRIPSRDGSNSDAVTSLALSDHYVLAAFGCGKLRMYLSTDGQLRLEISAHHKWINALAFNPISRCAATVSDDNLLCVWQMPTNENPKASLVAHKQLPNMMLTGVAFVNERTVNVAAYDVDHIFSFAL